MRFTLVSSLLPLAVTVGALSVTEPKKNVEIDPSNSFTVKWDSVNTDPSSFDLYLVNNAVYPNVEKKIASDVDTSDGSYTIDGISGLPNGHGYQINLFSNVEHNTGILAQSQQFNVTSGATSSSSTSSSSSSTTTSSTSSTSTKSASTTGTSSTTIGTLTKTTGTASSTKTAGSTSAVRSSSTTASSASASGTAADDTNAGAMVGAPLTAAAGLLAGALLFNL